MLRHASSGSRATCWTLRSMCNALRCAYYYIARPRNVRWNPQVRALCDGSGICTHCVRGRFALAIAHVMVYPRCLTRVTSALQVLQKCADIQDHISEGANSFLFTEYNYMAVFMVRSPFCQRVSVAVFVHLLARTSRCAASSMSVHGKANRCRSIVLREPVFTAGLAGTRPVIVHVQGHDGWSRDCARRSSAAV